jgi:hypothetical protein
LRRLGGTPSPLILKSMVALKFSGVVGRLPWTLFPPPAFTPLFQPTARLSNRQKAQPCRNSIGTHAATLRRSIAAAVNELSAERRPVLTEDQVRAMIGGGAEKRVERTFGAVEDFTDRSVCCLSTTNVRAVIISAKYGSSTTEYRLVPSHRGYCRW